MTNSIRHHQLMDASRSRLLVVDVQEKLVPAIHEHEAVVSRCRALADVASLYGIPRKVTEQYPKGLGRTVEALSDIDPIPAEKLLFSAAEASGFGVCEMEEERDQVVICGIETHICVFQTAMDLLAARWAVTVVADAVGSRHQRDHAVAIERLRAFGVDVATTESVLFEWAGRAGSDEFKQVSKIVREL